MLQKQMISKRQQQQPTRRFRSSIERKNESASGLGINVRRLIDFLQFLIKVLPVKVRCVCCYQKDKATKANKAIKPNQATNVNKPKTKNGHCS